MKHLISLATVAALCFIACTKPEEPVITPTISAVPSTAQFTVDGGSLKIAVTTNQEDYEVSGATAWLTVDKNGNELTLTASANTETEPRTCTLTLTASEATATIAVTQAKGSKYSGYTQVSAVGATYYGTLLAKYYDMPDSDGGYANITLTDEENDVFISLELFTELYASEDEVVVTEGTYTKGEDANMVYVGQKMTYVAGGSYTMDDEEFIYGSFVNSENRVNITDGTLSITKNADDTYVIKTDLKDAEGNDVKYYYEGAIDYDLSEATYPGGVERPDATQVVGAQCSYLGDMYEAGTTTLSVLLFCEGNSTISNFEFNIPTIEFEELSDLTGEYYSLESDNDYSAGTINKGSLMELGEGMSFPVGTYVFYGMNDYLVADAFASLILTKLENGHYSISAAMMDSNNDFLMYGIEDMEIPIIDGRDNEED